MYVTGIGQTILELKSGQGITKGESPYFRNFWMYRCVFDVVMHSNKEDWSIMADISKSRYNFSVHMKFCDLEDCTL